MTVSELITKIDIQIANNLKMSEQIIRKNEDLQKTKVIIQDICNHRYPDGSSAFNEYAHDGHHGFERCSLCQKEVTV